MEMKIERLSMERADESSRNFKFPNLLERKIKGESNVTIFIQIYFNGKIL